MSANSDILDHQPKRLLMLEESPLKHAKAYSYKYAYLILMLFVITASTYLFISKGSYIREDDRALYASSPSAILLNKPRLVRTIGKLSPQQEGKLPSVASLFPADVRKICFSRGDYIYLLNSDGGQLTRVTKGAWPSISQDGKMLAFVEFVEPDAVASSTRIKVADLETNQVIEFESLASLDAGFPLWSHDSTKLAVVGGKEMHIGFLDLKGGNIVNLAEKVLAVGALGEGLYIDPRNYNLSLDSWAADDKSLLCHDMNYLYEIDLEGNVIRKIPIGGTNPISDITSGTRFSFSDDKQYLLFETAAGEGDWETPTVYLFNLKSKILNRITPKGFAPYGPQWLPSGNEILFTNPRFTKESGYVDDVYMISLNSTTPTLLIKNASHASFTLQK